ncbi:SPOR domain-containing protein [Sphingomonas sp. ID0503]|uniref:SPOR domain-containing protein n=1 Tax=Sphingomonas sp. ID0503 TaxID=3399691 RepID=UPI003AFAF198
MRRALLTLAFIVPLPASADVAAGVQAWKTGDFERAVKEWTAPAEAGDPEAQVRLADAYLAGRGVSADPVKARALLEKAATKNQPLAQVNLGLLLFREGDAARAFPLLEKAAARKEPRAQYLLGTALFNGDRIKQDRVRGQQMMALAAASGLPQAKTSLARMNTILAAKTHATAQKRAVPALLSPGPAQPSTSAVSVSAAREVAPLAPQAKAGWRVQLGAFGSQAAAAAHWARLSAQPSLMAATPIYTPARSLYRLQAGPFGTAREAISVCTALRRLRQDCLPIRP